MRAWTSATTPGRCSFDSDHTWRGGARIFRVQGKTWTKHYCASCALSRQEAPPDTGEVLDVTHAPTYPTALKAFADAVGERFDARMAAAGKDEDPLFDEPFEEQP